MKYGLVVFKKSENLGDDIQSYATRKFLPSVDYLVEREHLDDFCPGEGECVCVILSGWYLYSHLNWPPSPYLCTLPISMHFDTESATVFGKDITNNNVVKGLGKNWLKDNEPIGARDYETKELLMRNGIEAYFSGCITLTLEPFDNIEKHNKIVVVDVGEKVESYLSEKLKLEFVSKTHKVHMENYSFDERMSLTEKQLRFYQGAALVITKRLHVALPCLALGTPVLLVVEEKISNRLKTYCNYLNVIKEKDLLEGKVEYDFANPPNNPNEHVKCAERLSRICMNYITECQNSAKREITSVEIFKDAISRTSQLKKQLIDELGVVGEKEKYKIYS